MSNNSRSAAIHFQHFMVKEHHILFNEPGDYRVKIEFIPEGVILPSLNQYELHLEVVVSDDEGKFNIILKTTSLFSYNPDTDLEELRKSYFIHNAPAIAFPYIRAYISALTALAGMPTLTLPTLNLQSIGDLLYNKTSIIDHS